MINDFETDDKEKAEAAFILYAIIKSRPDNSPINIHKQKFLDYATIRRYIKKIFKKSETISEFIEKFASAIGVELIDSKYSTKINYENNNLLNILNENTFNILALIQIRMQKDSAEFKEKYLDEEEQNENNGNLQN